MLALPLTEVSAKVSTLKARPQRQAIHAATVPSAWHISTWNILDAAGRCFLPLQVSAGWPNDDKEDLDLPIWAGVLPITQVSPKVFTMVKV